MLLLELLGAGACAALAVWAALAVAGRRGRRGAAREVGVVVARGGEYLGSVGTLDEARVWVAGLACGAGMRRRSCEGCGAPLEAFERVESGDLGVSLDVAGGPDGGWRCGPCGGSVMRAGSRSGGEP